MIYPDISMLIILYIIHIYIYIQYIYIYVSTVYIYIHIYIYIYRELPFGNQTWLSGESLNQMEVLGKIIESKP